MTCLLWNNYCLNFAGAIVTKVFPPKLGENISLAQFESVIARIRPKLVFVVQGESSTGVYQPLDGLGNICSR